MRPDDECSGWHPLPPAALTVRRAHTVLGTLTIAGALWLAGWWWWPQSWMQTAALLAFGLMVVVVPLDMLWFDPRRIAAYRYALDDVGLQVTEGLWWTRRLIVPADQILFVDVRQGPVQHALGLATLTVGTLGSTHDVGPVEFNRAQQLASARLDVEGTHASP